VEELRFARHHRSQFMWPWEETPESIAHGILDDETYDAFAILEGMLVSGGYPVTVSEARLAEANALARGVAHRCADATGTAGLAGLLELREHGLPPAGAAVAVLFTGGAR
jgi:threonine synthase